MIRNLQKQFKVSTEQEYPFNPDEVKLKTAQLYLNSQDKISGTNNEATFKINMPCEFTSSNIALTLTNFIPTYPSGADAGIVRVNMVGVENPNSYSSRNNSTHRTIGTFVLDGESVPKDYPPAGMNASSTNITGQSYGNGTYTARASSIWQQPHLAFDKSLSAFSSWGAEFGTYNTSNGVYIGSNTTLVDGSNVSGEWLDLETPQSIVVNRYVIRGFPQNGQGNVRSPNTFTIAGSTDGVSYTRIDTRSNINYIDTAGWSNTFDIPDNRSSFKRHRIIAHVVGNSNTSSSRTGFLINELIYTGFNNPQSGTTSTQPLRIGQCNMNAEIISTDRRMFDRPITLELISPSGLNLSSLSNWSCQLSVREML